MPIRLYTDEEIRDLRQMHKRVENPHSRWSEKPSRNPVHRERTFKSYGEDSGEYRFLIYQRQNILDLVDFSCGIVYLVLGGSRLTLARYNGSSHIHGDIHYRTHIHNATERAIISGKKPESTAEQTDRYETLEGAFACLIDDYNIIGIQALHDRQGNLF